MDMKMRRWLSSLGMGAAFMFFLASSVLGQDITAGIRGTVTDSTGSVVVGATVTAKNDGTGYTRETVTGSTGGYIFTLLPVGTYDVSVAMSGFKKYVRSGISLTVNQVVGVNVELQLGQVTQKVEVKASAVAVNTQTSETGMLTESRQIRELPLNGRNPIQLAALTNGVQVYAISSYLGAGGASTTDNIDGGTAVISVNGIRWHQTQFNLDGGEFAGMDFDSGLNYPNPDALQEFRFMTSGYGADFGRLPGGVMNAITKSGTNRIHGSAWEFNRNSAVTAQGYGNKTKPFLNQNQYGFTAGGPIIKDKLFLFGTMQWLKIATSLVASGQILPNALERTGDFTKDPTTGLPWPAGTHLVKDPLTAQPFPGNVIPANRLDPIAMSMLNLIPLPNLPNGTFYTQGSQPIKNKQWMLKGDYQASKSNRLSVSLFRDHTDGVHPFSRGGSGNGFPYANVTGPNFTTNGGQISNLIVSDTHVFKANLLNQFRFGYTRIRAISGQNAKVSPTMPDLNPAYPRGPLQDRPGIWISGRAFASRGTWGSANDDDYNVMDKVNYIRGRHNMKIGVEYRYADKDKVSGNNIGGVFWSGFPGSQTGNPLADFMLGDMFGIISSPSTNNWYQKSWVGYFQDDVKVSPRLVLNFGMRYQLAPYWTNTVQYKLSDGTLTTGVAAWNPGQQSKLFPTAPLGLVYGGDPGIPLNGSFTDKSNWTPRAGFAWDVFGTGKTSLRGGFGLFDEMPALRFINGVGVPFGSNQKTVITNGLAGFPGPNYYPAPSLSRNFDFSVDYPLTSQYFAGLHPRNSMVYEYNLTLEHELANGVVLSAAYVGNLGRRLPWARNFDPAVYIPGNNPVTGLPLSTVANTASRRVYNMALPAGSPNIYGEIGVYEDTASSSYNALQVQLRTRSYHGMTVQGNYTWAHAIDNQTSYYVELAANSTQNPNCLPCEKGNSDVDRRHQLILSYVYTTPSVTKALRMNNGVARVIFDNWGISGFSSFSTGGYGTIHSVNGDNSLSGNGKDRGTVVGNWRLPSGRSEAAKMAEYFNPAAFTQNATGTFGNVGRGIIPMPGSWGTDAAILKHFPLRSEQREIELRGEFFNALNHQNLQGPGLTVGAPGFGKIIGSAQGGRIIQFGLKFMF